MKINNHIDATLVQILSALCTRCNIDYESQDLAVAPFNDILGALARKTISSAIKKDGARMQRYQLCEELRSRFSLSAMEEEHVFPINLWKAPLLEAAKNEE